MIVFASGLILFPLVFLITSNISCLNTSTSVRKQATYQHSQTRSLLRLRLLIPSSLGDDATSSTKRLPPGLPPWFFEFWDCGIQISKNQVWFEYRSIYSQTERTWFCKGVTSYSKKLCNEANSETTQTAFEPIVLIFQPRSLWKCRQYCECLL